MDYDTKNIPGSPSIAETIFEKIKTCGVFVADLSSVAQIESGRAGYPPKLTPNPNVLIELGLAAGTIGWERIVLVLNTAFGSVDQLPFDLRHRRHPIQYLLADQTGSDSTKLDLADSLRTAIRTVIDSGIIKSKELVTIKCSPAIAGSGTMEKVLSIQVTNCGERPIVISGFGFGTSDNKNNILISPSGLLGEWPFPKRLQEAEYLTILVRAEAFRNTLPKLRANGVTISNVYVTDSIDKRYREPLSAGLVEEILRE